MVGWRRAGLVVVVVIHRGVSDGWVRCGVRGVDARRFRDWSRKGQQSSVSSTNVGRGTASSVYGRISAWSGARRAACIEVGSRPMELVAGTETQRSSGQSRARVSAGAGAFARTSVDTGVSKIRFGAVRWCDDALWLRCWIGEGWSLFRARGDHCFGWPWWSCSWTRCVVSGLSVCPLGSGTASGASAGPLALRHGVAALEGARLARPTSLL